MNGVGCRRLSPRIDVASTAILRHLKTQAAVGNLAHTQPGSDASCLRGNGRTVGLCRSKSRQRWLLRV